ncbi:MAG: hypothetical protein AAF804_09770 [Bacteroidota bacterium]
MTTHYSPISLIRMLSLMALACTMGACQRDFTFEDRQSGDSIKYEELSGNYIFTAADRGYGHLIDLRERVSYWIPFSSPGGSIAVDPVQHRLLGFGALSNEAVVLQEYPLPKGQWEVLDTLTLDRTRLARITRAGDFFYCLAGTPGLPGQSLFRLSLPEFELQRLHDFSVEDFVVGFDLHPVTNQIILRKRPWFDAEEEEFWLADPQYQNPTRLFTYPLPTCCTSFYAQMPIWHPQEEKIIMIALDTTLSFDQNALFSYDLTRSTLSRINEVSLYDPTAQICLSPDAQFLINGEYNLTAAFTFPEGEFVSSLANFYRYYSNASTRITYWW